MEKFDLQVPDDQQRVCVCRILPDNMQTLTALLTAQESSANDVRKWMAAVESDLKHKTLTDNQTDTARQDEEVFAAQGKNQWCISCRKSGHNLLSCWHPKPEFGVPPYVPPGGYPKRRIKKSPYISPNDQIGVFSDGSVGINHWLVDSGCAMSISNDESAFISLDRRVRKEIVVANNDRLCTVGEGNVRLKLRSVTGKLVK